MFQARPHFAKATLTPQKRNLFWPSHEFGPPNIDDVPPHRPAMLSWFCFYSSGDCLCSRTVILFSSSPSPWGIYGIFLFFTGSWTVNPRTCYHYSWHVWLLRNITMETRQWKGIVATATARHGWPPPWWDGRCTCFAWSVHPNQFIMFFSFAGCQHITIFLTLCPPGGGTTSCGYLCHGPIPLDHSLPPLQWVKMGQAPKQEHKKGSKRSNAQTTWYFFCIFQIFFMYVWDMEPCILGEFFESLPACGLLLWVSPCA